ncbi:low molecular weight protein-tyrosine-phosphatase [Candidatus Spongiihabitans sp.]|uniref:low molecular weight protein-tyrosine-phosphatase n=1 Tax=Candidatus Spongiihabitans sp. TaxID=3101308 RepID=UPI003C7D3B80
MNAHRILFVCMGNICRSPSAEGVFRKLVEQRGVASRFEIDSAGTGGWHIDRPADARAQQAARARDIDLSAIRARQVCVADTQYYDTIIAMDNDNQSRLLELADDSHRRKVRLLLEYADCPDSLEVPDPYYGGDHGFERALDLIEEACCGLLDQLLAQSPRQRS